MTERLVTAEPAGQVLKVELNRPEKRNALNERMRQELAGIFADFEASADLRVAVLSGRGPVFCAGADLHEMSRKGVGVPGAAMSTSIGRRSRCHKPVIAAVDGPAYAGGFHLVQSCHLVVASDRAQFAITEAQVGRGSPWAATLSGLLPERVVVEMLVTAAPLPARRAFDLGFVNRLVEPDLVVETAVELGTKIALNAPLSVAAGIRMVLDTRGSGTAEALQLAERIYEPVYLSADAIEGPKAFAEKRSPRWRAQ
jgi:enoyl-CoA hydratase